MIVKYKRQDGHEFEFDTETQKNIIERIEKEGFVKIEEKQEIKQEIENKEEIKKETKKRAKKESE